MAIQLLKSAGEKKPGRVRQSQDALHTEKRRDTEVTDAADLPDGQLSACSIRALLQTSVVQL